MNIINILFIKNTYYTANKYPNTFKFGCRCAVHYSCICIILFYAYNKLGNS